MKVYEDQVYTRDVSRDNGDEEGECIGCAAAVDRE
jgi:hypothetical protein